MKFSPADCISEKAPIAALGAIHDPEVFSIVKDLQKKVNRPLLLVTGPSGVGKTAIVENGLGSRIGRLSNQFRQGRVSVKIDDTSLSLASRCVREIWRYHPDLNRHITTRSNLARKQRATLLELVETDPVRAGKQLFTILRGLEKGVTNQLRDLRFMLHVDGLERLYENRVGSDCGDPFVPVFGPTADPFGFIREMMASKSLFIVLSYRDWVRDSIRKALMRSKIAGSRIAQHAIDWPTETRVSSVISRTILESKIDGDSHRASEIASRLVREFSNASPACVQHLPRVLATANDSNELDGYLCNTAENYYQSLPGDVRGGVARIVQRFSSGSATLPAREISNDPNLWKVANEMADGGLLCLSGRSLDTAEFSLISRGLFKSWDRAAKWTMSSEGSDQSRETVRQTDQFENHALSWDGTGRNADLLLHVDDSLARARVLLAQHSEKPMLSPLAAEFLQKSLDVFDVKSRRRKSFLTTGITIASAIAAAVGINLAAAGFSKNPTVTSNTKSFAEVIPAEKKEGLASTPFIAIQEAATLPDKLPTGVPAAGEVPVSEVDLEQATHQSTAARARPVLDPELVELAWKIAGGAPRENGDQTKVTKVIDPVPVAEVNFTGSDRE